jgi:hypothetical protein
LHLWFTLFENQLTTNWANYALVNRN